MEATQIASAGQGARTSVVVISCSRLRSTAIAAAKPTKNAIQPPRLYVKYTVSKRSTPDPAAKHRAAGPLRAARPSAMSVPIAARIPKAFQ